MRRSECNIQSTSAVASWSFPIKECFKNVMLFALCVTFASYLSHCFQQSWNRSALTTVHLELQTLSKSLQCRMESMEQHANIMIQLLKEITDKIEDRKILTGVTLNTTESQPKEDNILDNVQTMIEDALQKYDADKTGLTDFAMHSLGGCVISTRDTKSYKSGLKKVSILGLTLFSLDSDPKVMLKPGILPGECWAFAGTKGEVVIELATWVITKSVSLEHMPKSLSPNDDISSAPKIFSIWGLDSLKDPSPINLGTFTYDLNGTSLQTFQLQNNEGKPYKLLELEIESNHGNKEYTCVYRIRVHGELPGVKIFQ